jgi:hypothetical protein
LTVLRVHRFEANERFDKRLLKAFKRRNGFEHKKVGHPIESLRRIENVQKHKIDLIQKVSEWVRHSAGGEVNEHVGVSRVDEKAKVFQHIIERVGLREKLH